MDDNIFWNAEIPEMKRGYVFDEVENTHVCLVCGKKYEVGVIYPMEGMFFDAQKAALEHVKSEHSPLFLYYLNLKKSYTGLSETQTELARMFYEGLKDKEIAKVKDCSVSTVRNQRFIMREKYKQAKILTVLIEIMEEKMKEDKRSEPQTLSDFHRTATQIDERYAITQKEKSDIIERYFDENKNILIKTFPAKEKKKIIILQHIMSDFNADKKYSEPEINEIIKKYFDDFATVRRYLIEYGFLDRGSDCKEYWVKR